MNKVSELGLDYEFISDSQAIAELLNHIGYKDEEGDIGGLFVSTVDPDGCINGLRVFVCESNIPYNDKPVWELHPNNEYNPVV